MGTAKWPERVTAKRLDECYMALYDLETQMPTKLISEADRALLCEARHIVHHYLALLWAREKRLAKKEVTDGQG